MKEALKFKWLPTDTTDTDRICPHDAVMLVSCAEWR